MNLMQIKNVPIRRVAIVLTLPLVLLAATLIVIFMAAITFYENVVNECGEIIAHAIMIWRFSDD